MYQTVFIYTVLLGSAHFSSLLYFDAWGGKISLFIKKNSDADVCSYERSAWWTDARSQHHFLLASAVHAKVGLCITEVEEWETSGGLYRDNGEYDKYNTCGWWFLIATTDSTRRYFANYIEKDYSFSFLSCNFCTVYHLCFYTKRSYWRSIGVIELIFSYVM